MPASRKYPDELRSRMRFASIRRPLRTPVGSVGRRRANPLGDDGEAQRGADGGLSVGGGDQLGQAVRQLLPVPRQEPDAQ